MKPALIVRKVGRIIPNPPRLAQTEFNRRSRAKV